MKKYSSRLFLTLVFFSLFGLTFQSALAVTECADINTEPVGGICVPTSEATGLTNISVSDVIYTVLDWLLGIAGVVAMLVIVVGGVRYMISAGEDKKATAAKDMIVNGIIGLVVVLVAYSIVYTISGLLV